MKPPYCPFCHARKSSKGTKFKNWFGVKAHVFRMHSYELTGVDGRLKKRRTQVWKEIYDYVRSH